MIQCLQREPAYGSQCASSMTSGLSFFFFRNTYIVNRLWSCFMSVLVAVGRIIASDIVVAICIGLKQVFFHDLEEHVMI